MSRPDQLVAIFIVSTTGAFIAVAEGRQFDLALWLWGQIVLVFVAVSIHYANEYADIETDSLTERTMFSGGSGANSHVPRLWILRTAWIALVIGIVLSVIGILLGIHNFLSFVVLLIGGLLGWMYSLPPLQLAWRGWGELDNALLGGLFLNIYGYCVQAEAISLNVILVSLPFTALVFINLLATTWADKEADAQVGKYTLATRWQPQSLRVLYASMSIFAIIVGYGVLPSIIILGFIFSLPFLGFGWLVYTRWTHPHPTTIAMIIVMMTQFGGWWLIIS